MRNASHASPVGAPGDPPGPMARGVGSVAPYILGVAAVVACAVPWIFQGLDFTDDGFHLANQQALVRRGGIPVGSWAILVWGSDLVGAGWMAFLGGAGLIGARIGWVLLTAITAAASMRILGRIYGARRAAIAVALAAPMLLAHGRTLIDYNGVPTLFLLLAIDALGIGAASLPRWRDVLAGAMLLMASMARLPAAPAILAVGVLALRCDPGTSGRRWARGFRMALGFVAAALLGAVWLGVSGHAGDLLASAGLDDVRGTHALGGIVRAMGRDGVAILAVVAAGLIVARGCARARPTPRVAVVVAAVTFLGIAALTGGSIAIAGPAITATRWSTLLVGTCLAVLARAFVARRGDGPVATASDDLGAIPRRLLIVGLGVGLASCLGSDTGFTKVNRGLWLAVPAALLVGQDLLGRPGRWRAAWCALVLALGIGGLAIRSVSSYRDAPDRTSLTATIDHPLLRGIRTTPSRARSVEALVRALDGRTGPGDAVLAYGNVPLVQFLTDGVPALGHAWPDRLEAVEIERRLATLGRERALPVVVVRARCNTVDPAWPDEGRAARATAARDEHRLVIDAWLADHAYAIVWANADFEVLTR
jgi:hypothetical protein